MQSFLSPKEVVSFALVGDVFVSPERFVRISGVTKENGKNWSYTKEEHLPDGTRHGEYTKEKKKKWHKLTLKRNYKFGILHGGFSLLKEEVSKYRCCGHFEEGLATGKFKFYAKIPGLEKRAFCVFFERGLPTSFSGHNGNFSIVWEGNDVIMNGKKYTDVSFSAAEKHTDTEYAFFDPFRICLVSLLKKYMEIVRATNEQGFRVRIFIPVFMKYF
ncbi:hypothetical protein D1R32_gp094 [Tunisvirus fontaine2]|uniref:Uncharacterized protein n=1 Tax=Tunisvirus fontaine2 TaxID=1421067 RepID=V9SES6_9VIRU|nr:hypothetical protein D1R32_gp094 [Tunisvirus fontaine2]AHC54811.1 hypothetical protein TNS_ORF93 [Tunisvirus fontaine2]